MPFITQGKTNWKFLLIVIILAVIVGGGALWYAKRPETTYQPSEIGKSKIADWKTYRNEEYSFEIKYPSEWSVIDENPVYISPFSKKQIEAEEEHFGLFVMKYPIAEKEEILKWVEPEIIVPKISTSPEFEVKISEGLNSASSLKVEFTNLKKTEEQNLYEGVTYWLVGKESILRVAYDFPSEENKYKTVFEEMFSTFRFIGTSKDIVIKFPESEESKKVVFKSKPLSGFLIPTENSVPSQFKFQGSAFTDDYVRYHYSYCHKGEDGLTSCSRMNIIEDKRESYEDMINKDYLKPPKYITKSRFNYQNSEGVIIYYYYQDTISKESKLFEGWLYFNRSGHLLTIHTSDKEFLSNPDNFIDLLKKFQVVP